MNSIKSKTQSKCAATIIIASFSATYNHIYQFITKPYTQNNTRGTLSVESTSILHVGCMQWPFCPINGADRKVHLSSKQAIEHYYIIKLNDSFIDIHM